MKRYISTVFAEPDDERADAWDAWHRDYHVYDVMDVPGYLRCRRYRVAESSRGQTRWKYLIVSEIETDDLPVVIAELSRRYAEGLLPGFDTAHPTPLDILFWEETSRHERGDKAPPSQGGARA